MDRTECRKRPEIVTVSDPVSRRTAWSGPGPTDVAGLGTACTPDTGPLVRANPADAAVRTALLTGADVRVIAQETTMSDYAAEHAPSLRPPGRDLESAAERIELLEAQVQALGQAVRALIQGMEEIPDHEPDPERPARAARRAHELLLSQHL
ncbi:hypothetical protein [Kitasatospora sp. NPDC059673]|uniref:hypothetical protein n=1 Tax=Kitasatospora sp. NPDC059673 TaxID=3346901 RepID=UPI003686CE82